MWELAALGNVGGGGIPGFRAAVVLVAIWSLIVIAPAQRTALSPQETAALMARMDADFVAEVRPG